MDLKTYEKTRYQNIYRNKKNKNYVIMLSKPCKTSIGTIDGKKIYDIDIALKIRDKENKYKQNMIVLNYDFENIWDRYIFNCKNIKKLSYSSIIKKEKIYNKYLKSCNTMSIKKLTKSYCIELINSFDCTFKQKNEIMKQLKAFFNWCCEENYINFSPMNNVKNFNVTKSEMKYWSPNELKAFLATLDADLSSKKLDTKKNAYLIKTLVIIGFSLGDRIGETRALTFNSLNEENKTILINHSINYDTSSKDYLSTTKNYHSQRLIDVTDKLINTIKDYRHFLEVEMEYPVEDSSIIFFNYNTGKPYSDVALRKQFYKYCDKSNIKRIRMYDLRHTYVATMMAENKELYNISERIGHKNFNTTINKYGHLSNEVRKEIAKTTDKYI